MKSPCKLKQIDLWPPSTHMDGYPVYQDPRAALRIHQSNYLEGKEMEPLLPKALELLSVPPREPKVTVITRVVCHHH